ncbi:UNVERIFIED_CONTAM: hypothetical protein HDU68_002181 [Siphonaria sp. JEL0065]|nr:hypothetical protein HDU68_002181 [Siphonaria sp. JEL0065]
MNRGTGIHASRVLKKQKEKQQQHSNIRDLIKKGGIRGSSQLFYSKSVEEPSTLLVSDAKIPSFRDDFVDYSRVGEILKDGLKKNVELCSSFEEVNKEEGAFSIDVKKEHVVHGFVDENKELVFTTIVKKDLDNIAKTEYIPAIDYSVVKEVKEEMKKEANQAAVKKKDDASTYLETKPLEINTTTGRQKRHAATSGALKISELYETFGPRGGSKKRWKKDF